jgi:hypothetical protein
MDRSRPFSECRGDRQPEDPLYRVSYWQGRKVGGNMVLLPFDANEILVPDDGATEPRPGVVDNKNITYFPLYNQPMRDLVATMQNRAASGATKVTEIEEPADSETNDDDNHDPIDDVNLASWLRGEAKYEWLMLQKAAKKNFSIMFTSKKQMVEDLVLDHKMVPEDQVCEELAKHLPKRAA